MQLLIDRLLQRLNDSTITTTTTHKYHTSTMSPHAAAQEDQIEIELEGTRCNIRYESPPVTPRRQRSSQADLVSVSRQNSLVEGGAAKSELDNSMLQRISSIDSADQHTIYDSFTHLCAPDCSGVPKKSAMRKAPRGAIISDHNVSFNSLTVREYDLTLGDHPSSASGPPVQLDWEHKAENTMDLNDYEKMRQPRRRRRELKMSFQEREEILQGYGFTMDQLKDAWMESLKVRQQRYETIMAGSITTKMEEAWESACRKFGRIFTLSGGQEGFEVQAETKEAPTQWSYVSAEDDTPVPPASVWSLVRTEDSTPTWSIFGSAPETPASPAVAPPAKRVPSTGNSTLISV
jgi:hypothetical protein